MGSQPYPAAAGRGSRARNTLDLAPPSQLRARDSAHLTTTTGCGNRHHIPDLVHRLAREAWSRWVRVGGRRVLGAPAHPGSIRPTSAASQANCEARPQRRPSARLKMRRELPRAEYGDTPALEALGVDRSALIRQLGEVPDTPDHQSGRGNWSLLSITPWSVSVRCRAGSRRASARSRSWRVDSAISDHAGAVSRALAICSVVVSTALLLSRRGIEQTRNLGQGSLRRGDRDRAYAQRVI